MFCMVWGGEFGTQEGKDVWMCMGGLEFLV